MRSHCVRYTGYIHALVFVVLQLALGVHAIWEEFRDPDAGWLALYDLSLFLLRLFLLRTRNIIRTTPRT